MRSRAAGPPPAKLLRALTPLGFSRIVGAGRRADVNGTLDIDRLAAPIDGGSGVGEDLRQAVDASAFYALKDLRADARLIEREAALPANKNDEDAAAAPRDTPILQAGVRLWSELSEQAQALLASRTKDLELAGWLCEAQARLEGFAGVADGLGLMLRLLQVHWEAGLYPSEDEDGVEARLAPVAGLLGLGGAAALLQPIKLIPLSDRDPNVALWTLEAANAPMAAGNDAEARDRAQQRRAERLEAVRQAVVRSSPGFLRDTHAAVMSALDTVGSLVEACDVLGGTGPFGSQVADPLRAIADFLEKQAGHLLRDPEAETAGDEEGADAGVEARAAPGSPGRIGTRDDAFDAVLRVADWFAATEPQSIVARSLREVVRRARMPLDDLLRELLPENDQRLLFLMRAGVKAEPEAASSDF